MKQKIVIKVHMTCDKCRTKAMKIAATSSGVISVGIQGPDKDQLVITGEGVDSACLTRSLKKKLCYATILTVEEVKEEKPKPPEPPPPPPPPPPPCHCVWPPPPPHPMYCGVVCQDQNPSSCPIM